MFEGFVGKNCWNYHGILFYFWNLYEMFVENVAGTYMGSSGEEPGGYPGYGARAAPEAQVKEHLLGVNTPGQQQRVHAEQARVLK